MWTPIFFFFYTSVLQSWQNCGQLKLDFKLTRVWISKLAKKLCWALTIEAFHAHWMLLGDLVSDLLCHGFWEGHHFAELCLNSALFLQDKYGYWNGPVLTTNSFSFKNAIATTQFTKSINSSPHTLKTAIDEILNGQDLPVSDIHESVIIYSHKL